MNLQNCNPFLRAAEIQPAVFEGGAPRRAYDHRIFLILEGEGSLILSHATHPLSANTLIFLRPGIGYHFKGKMQVVVLNFDLTRREAHRSEPICPPPAAEYDPEKVFDTTVLPEPAEPLILPGQRHLRQELLELANTFCAGDAYADAITSALLKKLLAELIGAPRQKAEPGQALVRRLEQYIRLYAPEIQGNEQLGKVFGYHPVYIAALFKEQTGRSLHRAILSRRIELGCQWLIRTELSVESIAFDTGFSSRSHFCTAFKAQMGCSPRQYREKNRS